MRDATTAFATEAAKVRGAVPVRFLKADFGQPTPGSLFLWDGVGEKVWNGDTYLSGLGLIQMKAGAENADGSTSPTTFTLPWKDKASGRDLVAAAMQARSGGRVYVAKGWLDDAGAIVVDPIYTWTGRISSPIVQEGRPSGAEGAALTIQVTAEEYSADRDRSHRFRITLASHLEFDATDTGLAHQASLSSEDLKWGYLYFKSIGY